MKCEFVNFLLHQNFFAYGSRFSLGVHTPCGIRVQNIHKLDSQTLICIGKSVLDAKVVCMCSVHVTLTINWNVK